MMGSRILSRSFSLGDLGGEPEDVGSEVGVMGKGKDSNGDRMDVDEAPAAGADDSLTDPDGDEGKDEDEDEDASDVAMVPMADMLNARYGSENVHLFTSFAHTLY
jgi:SET domain-containing protein 6